MIKSNKGLKFLALIFLSALILSSLSASVKAITNDNNTASLGQTKANLATLSTITTTPASSNESALNDSILPDFVWQATIRMNPNATANELAQIREQTVR
jgi:hypothetical protein